MDVIQGECMDACGADPHIMEEGSYSTVWKTYSRIRRLHPASYETTLAPCVETCNFAVMTYFVDEGIDFDGFLSYDIQAAIDDFESKQSSDDREVRLGLFYRIVSRVSDISMAEGDSKSVVAGVTLKAMKSLRLSKADVAWGAHSRTEL